jgi:hypothetical protein
MGKCGLRDLVIILPGDLTQAPMSKCVRASEVDRPANAKDLRTEESRSIGAHMCSRTRAHVGNRKS